MLKTNRHMLGEKNIHHALEVVAETFDKRLKEKGTHILVSTHEILGIVEEECTELKDAVRSCVQQNVKRELVDIAVACLAGIASIDSKKMDW